MIHTVKTIEHLGDEQYRTYVRQRFVENSRPITDTIKKNNLPLFSTTPDKAKSKQSSHQASLKRDCQLFSRLYIACQSRDGDLTQFFQHENQSEPPSLSFQGKLRTGTKSDALSCLEGLPTPAPIANTALPSVSAMFIDGEALVNILKPKASRTFDDYAATEYIPYLERQLEGVERLDVVWDQYPSDSLKQQAREARGSGTRRRILGNTGIPKNWVSFLRNDENKTELFTFLAVKISRIKCGNKEICTTCLERVLTAHPCNPESLSQLDPCNHAEADSRIFLHAACAAAQGHMKLAIRTVDTDVVVIAVAYIHRLPIEELWITFGTGKHYRIIPAHALASALGPEKSRGLLFWHAFSACDTVSSFAGRGKKTAWDVWMAFPGVNAAFSALSTPVEDIGDINMALLERFVVLLYSKSFDVENVNQARQTLFAKGTRTLENIPPTHAALQQLIKRAVLQAGYIWGQAIVPIQQRPTPALWGWEEDGNGWTPKWTHLPEAATACYELIHCGCKQTCRSLCKCHRANLRCTALCTCGGNCSQRNSEIW